MTEVVMGVKVLLADDSQFIRQGIKNLFAYHPGITLVAEAETLDEAVTKSAELMPDVVVLDLHLLDGGVTPVQRAFISRMKIVVITFGADAISKNLAQRIGAQALLDKSDLSTELVPAILKARSKGAGAG
jgi:two-component system, NarL family, response regulator DevR